MVTDLLLAHPSPQNLHIIPTARDPRDNLALSSRNAYLSTEGRAVAGTLYKALKTVEEAWEQGKTKEECIQLGEKVVEDVKERTDGAEIRMDYIEMNDSANFEVLQSGVTKGSCFKGESETPIILSGAMWVDGTRLIDNILLGDVSRVVR